MNAIETMRLTKFYGRDRGIEELTLSVAEGDFFGFIGPNGAGKSTTIRVLLGLIAPTGGEARIFGRPAAPGDRTILSQVGYMPSEAQFHPELQVGEVLRFSARLRGLNCGREAAELCRRLQLDPRRRIRELSLGNRKKVSIVCAMQHRPRLYILDEPTSGLDPLMQREFYALLRERNQEGATVFLSSHVLSEIQRYCRSAAVIRAGRVLTSDRVERLGHTGAKRVNLMGVAAPPALPGVRDLRLLDGGVSFLYSGEARSLTAALAPLPLTDLTVAEPDLEEVFLHYYGEAGDGV